MKNVARKLPSRTEKQQRALGAAAKNAVPDLGERVPPRSDLVWTRPGAADAPERVDLPRLLERLIWQATRRGAPWDDYAASVIAGTKAHAWQYREVSGQAVVRTPAWLLGLLPGRRRAALALAEAALTAHRAGALGCLLSYTEIAALYDVSPRTAARWASYLEEQGIVEVVQTWREAPEGSSYHRGYAKQLYRPGPKMREAAGLGMLEGARGLQDGAKEMARRCARLARARRRAAMNKERNRRFIEVNGDEPLRNQPRHEDQSSPPPSGAGHEAPVPGEVFSKARPSAGGKAAHLSTPSLHVVPRVDPSQPNTQPGSRASRGSTIRATDPSTSVPRQTTPSSSTSPSSSSSPSSSTSPSSRRSPSSSTSPSSSSSLDAWLENNASPDRPTFFCLDAKPSKRFDLGASGGRDAPSSSGPGSSTPPGPSPLDAWLQENAGRKRSDFFCPDDTDEI